MSVDGLTKCPSCPRMFLTKTVFKFHLRTHAEAPAGPVAASSGSTRPPSSPGSPNTSGEVQKFESGGEESPEAGTTLKSGEKNDLSSSKKMVTGKPEKFKCEHCHKVFGYGPHLKRHIQTVHEKMRPFKCQQCNKSFTCKSNLQYHIQIDHEKIIKPFKCQQCVKSFSSKRYLQLHIQTVHEDSKLNTCHHCEKSFTHKANLKCHLQTAHKKRQAT